MQNLQDELAIVGHLEEDERDGAIAKMAAEATTEKVVSLFNIADNPPDEEAEAIAIEVLAKVPVAKRLEAIEDTDYPAKAYRLDMKLQLQPVVDLTDEAARDAAIAAEAAHFTETGNLGCLYDLAVNATGDIDAVAASILAAVPLEKRIQVIASMEEGSDNRNSALEFEQKLLSEADHDEDRQPIILIIGTADSKPIAQALADILITGRKLTCYPNIEDEEGFGVDMFRAIAAILATADPEIVEIWAVALDQYESRNEVGAGASKEIYAAAKAALERNDLIGFARDSLEAFKAQLVDDYAELKEAEESTEG